MTIIRPAVVVTCVLAFVNSAAAQTGVLFDASLSNALRQGSEQASSGVRRRPANRRCIGCEQRPATAHLIADSPMLTDAWIAGHEYRGTDPAFGDNKVVADFWYDAVH